MQDEIQSPSGIGILQSHDRIEFIAKWDNIGQNLFQYPLKINPKMGLNTIFILDLAAFNPSILSIPGILSIVKCV